MLIQKEMKLADVIHHDHNLVPVINRFNIQLGFGEKTILELTIEKNINTDFFLIILNAYHDHQYFPRKHLQSFPASLLIDYLKKSHNYYLENKIPEIDSLINNLNEEDGLDTETDLMSNEPNAHVLGDESSLTSMDQHEFVLYGHGQYKPGNNNLGMRGDSMNVHTCTSATCQICASKGLADPTFVKSLYPATTSRSYSAPNTVEM